MRIAGSTRTWAGVVGLATALMATLAASALAHSGDYAGTVKPAEVVGGNAQLQPNGLYQVRLADGRKVSTHGPDLAAEAGASAVGDPERVPVCATDNFQHVLYGRPSGAPNRITTVRSQIQAAFRRMNYVLNADSIASGGPTADYKVRCDGGGQIQVDVFTSGGQNSFTNIVNGAIAAGFNSSNADYTIFFDGTFPGVCGVGSYIDDDRLIADNFNNSGGSYAISYAGCWDNETPMHENGHNQGAVQRFAPFSTGTGAHCIDEADVMCYSPDGGDVNQGGTISVCTDRIHYDCGWDTYFDSAPESGEWLFTHWNIGSTLNRFIAFDAPPPPPPPPPPPGKNALPNTNFTYTCNQLACNFTDRTTDADGTIVSRSWNFGDGGTSTETNPSHTFPAQGSYNVSLTAVDDDGGSKTITKSVFASTKVRG